MRKQAIAGSATLAQAIGQELSGRSVGAEAVKRYRTRKDGSVMGAPASDYSAAVLLEAEVP
jgi:hypothetical protein